MQESKQKTLRLHFPQWQGGNNSSYFFGAQLLSWLAPPATGPVATVDITPSDGSPLPMERGIVGRSILLKQLDSARQLIDRHQPDRIAVLGGDCLVDLAPFSYLNERYDGNLAVLWIDAHPDVMTPRDFSHAHAMVLGNLLGEGDSDFSSRVKQPLKPENIMYAGLQETLANETETISRLGLRFTGPAGIANDSDAVLKWLSSISAKHLAVHIDLDVLDPRLFRSVLFADPTASVGQFDGVAQGGTTIAQIVRLLKDVSQVIDIVGIGIAEHLPWDAIALKEMLAQLPLLGNPPAISRSSVE